MSEYHIVIAERGWVYVGKTRREADQLVIEDCFNIRRWGTTKGIGEIALGGPTENTVLDYYGTVRVHVLAIPGMADANDEVWRKWIAKELKRKS